MASSALGDEDVNQGQAAEDQCLAVRQGDQHWLLSAKLHDTGCRREPTRRWIEDLGRRQRVARVAHDVAARDEHATASQHGECRLIASLGHWRQTRNRRLRRIERPGLARRKQEHPPVGQEGTGVRVSERLTA